MPRMAGTRMTTTTQMALWALIMVVLAAPVWHADFAGVTGCSCSLAPACRIVAELAVASKE